MGRIIIYPYKMGSASAKALQDQLKQMVGHTHRVLRVRPNGRYRKRSTDLIINWGSSTFPGWGLPSMNGPIAVALAANKLKTFNALRGVPTPDWTTDRSAAQHWVDQGQTVFARTLLTGHSGNGIILCSEGEVPEAPLYTGKFNKTREYRVHVWQGGVLDVQEKRKRSGTGTRSDYEVWNHGNDFIFAREDVQLPQVVEEAAIRAIHQLDLDFGAVDIGYNHRDDVCCVFEVNTAPGLTGTTLTKYAEAIINENAP